MRSKSEIKTTKHIVDRKIAEMFTQTLILKNVKLFFERNAGISQNQRFNEFNQLPLIGAEFNELTLTEVHNCVNEVVVNEANVLH